MKEEGRGKREEGRGKKKQERKKFSASLRDFRVVNLDNNCQKSARWKERSTHFLKQSWNCNS
ncbi:hypothetical protein D0A34_06545 [Microcoleus vaginatus PCC 9802]|nr:hypothetical protein D0A34_06545 [Microcoleus vaginatus PCC 9802]